MQTDIAVTRQLDPFNPALKRTQEMPQGTRLQTCFDDLAYVVPEHQDLVLFLNAKPVMRAQWDYKIQTGDHVLIKPYPRGGDGGGMRQVAQIGLSAAAMYVGGPWGAALMIGGSLAMNEFMPIPEAPSPQNTQPFSNTYQSQSRGNVPKPMQAMPVQFGELEIYPDEGARSYFAYEDNKQVYYQLLCLGHGDYSADINLIKIGADSIYLFEGYQTQLVPMGGTLTLVNPSVTSAPINQTLLDSQVLNSGQYVFVDGLAHNSSLIEMRTTYWRNEVTATTRDETVTQFFSAAVGDHIRFVDGSGAMSDVTFVESVVVNATDNSFIDVLYFDRYADSVRDFIYAREISGVLFDRYACWPILWDVELGQPKITAMTSTIDSPDDIESIQIDIALPKDTSTTFDTVNFTVHYRLMDANNNPTGSWQTLTDETLTRSASEALYLTRTYSVNAGRYQLKIFRDDYAQSAGDQLFITGIKGTGSTQSNTTISENCALLAIKVDVPADNNITLGETRVMTKRKLQTLQSDGTWSAPQITSEISAALAEALRIRYGDDFENYLMPLDELYALQQTWTARGDEFNGRFDQQIVLKEAMQLIARAGRAIALEIGDRWYFVRDEPGVATYPYSPANIIANPDTAEPAYSIQHKYPLANDPDGIVVEFFNRDVWEWDETPSYPTDAVQPKRIRFFGITDTQHAWRECCYLYYREIIKPSTVTFRTELEALNHGFGDLLSIAPPKSTVYGAGVVENYDAGTQTLELSEPLEWSDTGYHFLNLRRDDGTTSGPYEVTQGTDVYHCVFKPGTSLDILPHNGYSQTPQREPTHYQFGKTSTGFLARLTGRKQTGTHEFELTAEIVNPLAHTIDQTPYPS